MGAGIPEAVGCGLVLLHQTTLSSLGQIESKTNNIIQSMFLLYSTKAMLAYFPLVNDLRLFTHLRAMRPIDHR